MTAILAERTFSLEDQRAFAALSGDWNPIHHDAVAARRTLMGAPVVHGVHLVAWAIDRVLAAAPGGPAGVKALRARFARPVYLDQKVELAMLRDGAEIVASVDGTEIRLELGPPTPCEVPLQAWPEPEPPVMRALGELVGYREELPLAIDPRRAAELFPALVERLGPGALAELLATTRLVGMRCPGLHSLFAGLELFAHATAHDTAQATLVAEVASVNPKYSQVALRVTGPTLAGKLDTFYRPPPRTVAMADAIRAAPSDRAFADQRALVVGGTRGLGEAFAKAIAAGGGEVCITYHRGAGDAERVVADIVAAGGRAVALQLDVEEPLDLATRWPLAEPPTHVYYAATPTLYSIRKGAVWRASELEQLVRVYVTGLRATIAAAVALGAEQPRARPLVVWVPSTTMLDAPTGGTAYCVAKAAMEELCRHLPRLLPVRIHVPRIGRIDTDQTAGLVALRPAPPLDVAVAQLVNISRSDGSGGD